MVLVYGFNRLICCTTTARTSDAPLSRDARNEALPCAVKIKKMRWGGRRQSQNIEDRRGMSAKGAAGLGGIGLVIAIAYALLTGDLSGLQQVATAPRSSNLSAEQQAHYREFVGVTLADTEEVWTDLFRRMGRTYEPPRLVLFEGSVDSACGFATSAVGPFYCGLDKHIYLDMAFFEEMEKKLGAGGDFAHAYVIAHEVGHHIQKLMGTLDQVHAQRQRLSEREANRLSVRLELQADYYAGVWAHHAREMAALDQQDIREGMNAASAIGDDTLQQRGQGKVVPDSFTHGTSEQRMRWFMAGYRSGDPAKGDTFAAGPDLMPR
jgi:uncharacterized protein